MKKGIFTLLLVLCMVCTVAVMGTMTASAAETSGSCGENVTWVFDSQTGTLTISGTGQMYYPLPTPPSFEDDPFYFDDVTSVAPWASVEDSIKKIVVSEGITNLYEKAFTGCYNVTEVSLPTTLESIGEKVFYGCTSLKTVELPENLHTIQYMAFFASGLESVVLPANVVNIHMDAFGNCKSLRSVVLPENLKTLQSFVFQQCDALTSVTFPAGLRVISNYAFYRCSSLENVTLPDGMTTIEYHAFDNCTALRSIEIPAGVTKIDKSTFQNCLSLTDVTIAGANVIDENAFYNCLSLKSVTASHGLTTINDNAFAKCKELVHLDLPGTVTYIAVNAIDETALYNDTANWENGILYVGKYLFKTTNLNYEELVVRDGTTVIGEGVFQDFTSLKKLTLPHSVTTIQQSAFSGCSGLTSVVIPEAVKSIEYRAFYNCTGLESVAILGNITSFGRDVFCNCSHLSSVTIAGATRIPSGAFEACAALEEITIPENVTFIGSEAFMDCISLQKVNFSTTYIEEIEMSAFENCVSLKSMALPEGIGIIVRDIFSGCISMESVTIPESAWCMHSGVFSGCTALKSIYIPKNLTSIDETFSGCTALTAIWIDKDNSKYSSDDRGVMYNKDKTTLITFPRGYVGEYVIPHTVTTIGERTFSSCKKLTSITIPAGVKSIGSYAFGYCTNLESVTLSRGITTLGQQAFIHCTALRSINIPNTLTSIGKYAFSGCMSMERFCVEEGNPNYSADEYGVLYNADKTKLLKFPAGYQGAFVVPESVTNIDHGAFSSAKGLTAVTIPGTVYAITSNCFSGCTNLTEVTICEGVASLYNHAFYGCSSLQTVVLPKSVRSTDYMTFAGCTNLTDLYILNPRCSFASGPAPIADPEITTLYGEVGSTTEKYATKNGFKFMPLTDSVKITINHSVELANELSINYMVRADLLQSYEGYDYTLKVVLPVYEGNTQTGTTTMELQPVLKGNYYYFILTGLNATRMNDTMQATLHISNGLRQVLSQTDSYSIATYAYNQLRKEGASEGLKKMCADLLRYGGKSQLFKGYRTNARADAKMTAEQKTYLTDLSAVTFNGYNNILDDVQNPTVTWAGKSLDLGSKVVLRYVINTSAYMGDVESLSLRVTYTDSQGQTVTVDVTEPKVFREDLHWYAFDFDGLRVAELRAALSVAVYDGDVQVSPTLEYGVESYCSGKVNDLGTLCRAMMAYSDSARDFFGK